MKRITISIILILSCVYSISVHAQKRSKDQQKNGKETETVLPKLVVGIVVDQMRYDYLSRFMSHYGEGGFKRLVDEGFTYHNHHFNYAPTKTAPGHTAVYSGATPAISGIMGNDWYDRKLDSIMYCVDDADVESVGTLADHGKKSPHKLKVSTITDQLRLHYNNRSKVISIAFKDRSSILPGGHTANAAYWYYGMDEGKWISSSYYMDKLPTWVESYNNSDAISKYKIVWKPLKDMNTYIESGPDNNTYERLFTGESAPVLPRDIPALWDANEKYNLLKYTPQSNSITTDFALEAIRNEYLGVDAITDILAISYSATDEIGHKYGPDSKEIQDTYIRLDRDLERLLSELDKKIGKGKYTVFLTADHGVSQVPSYLIDQDMPGGYFDIDETIPSLNEFLNYRFGSSDLIKGWYNNQIFLDQRIMANLDLEPAVVQGALAAELREYKEVEMVLTATQLNNNTCNQGIAYLLKNGFSQLQSGDVYYVLKPGYIDYDRTGTDHGSPYEYDTHVPMIYFGCGINIGSSYRRTEITDIAPTLARLLQIASPNTATGNPMYEVLK